MRWPHGLCHWLTPTIGGTFNNLTGSDDRNAEAQVADFFRNPTTIRLNLQVIASQVQYGNIRYDLRFVGDRRSPDPERNGRPRAARFDFARARLNAPPAPAWPGSGADNCARR